VTTPTLMLQGRSDFLFDVDQALTGFKELRGPKRLYLGDFGHAPSTFASPDLEYAETEVRQWFDRFLKDEPNGIDKRPPIELAKSPFTGTVQFPRPPVLTSYRFTASGGSFGTGALVRTFRLPKRPIETFGSATISTTVTSSAPTAHLVGVLSVLGPTGAETVLSDGGVPLRVPARSRRVTIRLMNQVVSIPRGGLRLKLTLAGTSSAQSAGNLLYLLGNPLGTQIKVGKVRVTLSTLRKPVSR
jgi:predicted acyl esterase